MGILPPDVRGRVAKGNLSAGFRQNLLGRSQAAIEQVVFAETPVINKYVDLALLRGAYRRYAASLNPRGSTAMR